MVKLDQFTRAYVTAALWSTVEKGDGGHPLGFRFTERDIAPVTLATMIQDCAEFQAANWADIQEDLERAGKDFLLSRNHSGAGFLDGDWDGAAASRLTDAAEAFGEVDLEIGADGLIYQVV